MSLVNFVGLVPRGYRGFVLSWMNFFLMGQNYYLVGRDFLSWNKIFSCGLTFFPLHQNFSSWVGFFFSRVIFFVVGEKLLLSFFAEKSKFYFRGITQVFSIDHDQTKLLGKLGVLVSKMLGMIGNHGK